MESSDQQQSANSAPRKHDIFTLADATDAIKENGIAGITNRIVNADCLEVMKQMPDKSVDLVVTDPPYGTTNLEWDIVPNFEKLWSEMLRVGKESCAFIFTASQPFTTDLINSNRAMFKYEMIWEKERPSNIFLMGKQVGKTHENIAIFYASQPTFNPQKTPNGKNRTRETMQKYVGNKLKHQGGKSITSYRSDWDGSVSLPRSVLYFVRDSHAENHPTQKPVALLNNLVATFSNKDDVIFDPFLGSGTTAVAAKQLGRNFIGIELSQRYCDIANERLRQDILL